MTDKIDTEIFRSVERLKQLRVEHRDLDQVISRLAADTGGAGSVVGGTPVVVDRRDALAPIGLLAADHPDAAAALAADLVREVSS